MVVKGLAETGIWLTRLLQLFFAVILTGVLSWFVHIYHDGNFDAPREVIVPEVFSVLAIFVSVCSIIAICFLGHFLQLVAAFLDFAIFVGYLASAALLRHNYHSNSNRNPLAVVLIAIRGAVHENRHITLVHGLVKLVVALVVIQTILFFFTALLSAVVASRSGDRRRSRAAV